MEVGKWSKSMQVVSKSTDCMRTPGGCAGGGRRVEGEHKRNPKKATGHRRRKTRGAVSTRPVLQPRRQQRTRKCTWQQWEALAMHRAQRSGGGASPGRSSSFSFPVHRSRWLQHTGRGSRSGPVRKTQKRQELPSIRTSAQGEGGPCWR